MNHKTYPLSLRERVGVRVKGTNTYHLSPERVVEF